MNLGQIAADRDAAKRISDAVNLHLVANKQEIWEVGTEGGFDKHGSAVGRWIACKLSDGSSDGVLYETRNDAIKHQLHELQCCYIKIPFDGMSEKDAWHFLKIHRQVYDAGFKMTDPEGVVNPYLHPSFAAQSAGK